MERHRVRLLPLSLIIDPTNANILYAGFNGDLQKTVDGGDTWVSSANGIDNPLVFSLAIDPNNTSVLYAGTAGTGAFKSVDGGATWNPLNIDTTVWSVYVDPTNSNVIYAGSNGNGVYKSTNAGASFVRTGSPVVGVVLSLAKSWRPLVCRHRDAGSFRQQRRRRNLDQHKNIRRIRSRS